MQTVAMMVQMVNESYQDRWIMQRSLQLVDVCLYRDWIPCSHQELLNWVKSNIRFVPDPIDLETLKHPVTWIERRIKKGQDVFGDCASMSVYLATLLKSVGHNPQFKVVGRGDYLHHVYVLCHGEELDPTMGYGEAPQNPKRIVIVDI